jgi:hypothetical protein
VEPLLAVRGIVILATIAWASAEILKARTVGLDPRARTLWTLAFALTVAHVLLAFQFVYGWDHAAAVASTVRQAADQFGVGWTGIIYINYAFLALWLGDVWWCWASPASYAARARRLEAGRAAIFLFMFVNGAVIFAAGVGRLVGVVAVTSVAIALIVPKAGGAARSTSSAAAIGRRSST